MKDSSCRLRCVTALLCLGLTAVAASEDAAPRPIPVPIPRGSAAPAATSDAAAYVARIAHAHADDEPVAAMAKAEAAMKRPIDAVGAHWVTIGQVDEQPVRGYLAMARHRPEVLPAVLVFHEWWGLNSNIQAMTLQLAAHGYAALAVDLYSGAVAKDPQRARALATAALGDPARLAQVFTAANQYLQRGLGASRIATLGWCLGGTMSLEAAAQAGPQIDAAVIYYGQVTGDRQKLAGLTAPVLAIFGGADDSIPERNIEAFGTTLASLGRKAEIHIYEGAPHAFANPSGKSFQPAAAADAWLRTLAFLDQHLKTVTP